MIPHFAKKTKPVVTEPTVVKSPLLPDFFDRYSYYLFYLQCLTHIKRHRRSIARIQFGVSHEDEFLKIFFQGAMIPHKAPNP